MTVEEPGLLRGGPLQQVEAEEKRRIHTMGLKRVITRKTVGNVSWKPHEESVSRRKTFSMLVAAKKLGIVTTKNLPLNLKRYRLALAVVAQWIE